MTPAAASAPAPEITTLQPGELKHAGPRSLFFEVLEKELEIA